MPLAFGSRLGAYKIGGAIGVGGMDSHARSRENFFLGIIISRFFSLRAASPSDCAGRGARRREQKQCPEGNAHAWKLLFCGNTLILGRRAGYLCVER